MTTGFQKCDSVQSESSFPERGLNELFGELWSVYLARVLRLVIISFVSAVIVFAVTSGIDAALPEGTQPEINAILESASEDEALTDEQIARVAELQIEGLPLQVLGLFLLLAVTIGVSALAAGAYMYVIGAHFVVGRVLISEALSFAIARVGSLLITTAMALGTVFAAWIILFLAPILISNAFADVQLLAVLFGLLSFTGLVGAVVISAYVAIRWTFIWPVVAFDGLIGIAALRRSWELTEGYWWRTFGVLLMVSLAVFAVGFPALLFGGIGGDAVGKWYSDIVAPTIAGPIQAIMIFLLYADLRTRRETPPGYGPDQISQELALRPINWDDAP